MSYEVMNRKMLIFSAPSGGGKTTIVKAVLKQFPELAFSVSTTSRPQRPNEINGVDYYFISTEEFRKKIANEEFIEWQEVYPGIYYGTLKSELERIWALGKNPVFDIDVKGALNLKNIFQSESLTIFIQPPSLQILEQRLRNRGTETEESLARRLGKAAYELTFATYFDAVIVNDQLQQAIQEAIQLVADFLHSI